MGPLKLGTTTLEAILAPLLSRPPSRQCSYQSHAPTNLNTHLAVGLSREKEMPEHDAAIQLNLAGADRKSSADITNNIRLLFKIKHSVLTPTHVLRPAVYRTAPWWTQTATGGDCRKVEQNWIGVATQQTISSGNWADSLNTQRT